jgi:hypothetical protein
MVLSKEPAEPAYMHGLDFFVDIEAERMDCGPRNIHVFSIQNEIGSTECL